MMIYYKTACFLFLAFLLASCYPTEERHTIRKEELTEARNVKVPTKIHLVDGSVILCDNGFTFQHDTIRASGTKYPFSSADSIPGYWTIPLDTVAGLEYFDKAVRGSRVPGSILLQTTIVGEIAAGSIIILKAIFGSCPTVYSFDSTQEHLEAECFSYSIGKKFEMADLDQLSRQNVKDGHLTLRLKNEALETHYIDKFRLCYADHPAGTEVFPTDDGHLITTGRLVMASSAVNSEGKDVLDAIRGQDDLAYKCDSASVSRMFAEKRKDWIDCVVPLPRNASTVNVVLRAKNSLQNTTLLYDVMMRNQGLNVLQWSREINENLFYAWKLGQWYKEFSGIELLVYQDNEYRSRERFSDTGPIAWKRTAARIPLDAHEDSLRIRLRFLPDNWAIDWIGFDVSEQQSPSLEYAACIDAKNHGSSAGNNIIETIGDDDGNYFVTYPGESVDLTFAVPPQQNAERTFFVQSKGYYVEWIRPEWVRERPDVPGFDISRKDELAARLSQLWLTKKNKFEDQFYHDRIPSWNSGGGR